MKILLTGGTGYFVQRLLPVLLHLGHDMVLRRLALDNTWFYFQGDDQGKSKKLKNLIPCDLFVVRYYNIIQTDEADRYR